MTDLYPNIDEFGRGATTCNGTMTGCAVCSTGNVLVRYRKAIPRLSDGTPNMRELGRRMGARHRSAVPGNKHGLSLAGQCCCQTNWCAYCSLLELRANGLPAVYKNLSWAGIEGELAARHPVVLPGHYGRVPIVSKGSYTSTKPARGRSDTLFTAAHMVVAWDVASRLPNGGVNTINVSDSDFGSPSRPTVPPHSVWSRATAQSFWSFYGWGVTVVTIPPPTTARVAPWWGSDVADDIQRAYSARYVASKLGSLGVTNYGKAINDADLEAGLRVRHINYGTSVQLIDVRALMKAGTT